MSKITDAEANATSLDGLVNDNGLITTLRNGPKPSYQYLVDGWNTEFNTLIDNLDTQGDAAIVAINEDVATVESLKNSATSLINSDVTTVDNAATVALSSINTNKETIETAAANVDLTIAELDSKYKLTMLGVDGAWASGIEFTAYNQYLVYNGTAYQPKPSTNLPYTTGATPNLSDVQPITVNNADGIILDDGGSVQEYIDGQQFASVDAVKAYSKLSKLIGQRITTGEHHTGTGYGGATYEVVSAGSVTPNDMDIIQGVADSGAAISLVIGKNISPTQLGAGTGLDDYSTLLRCAQLSYTHKKPIYGYGYEYSSSGTVYFSDEESPSLSNGVGWEGGTLKITSDLDYAIAPTPNATSVTEGGFLKNLIIDCNHLSGGFDPHGTRGFAVTDCTAKRVGDGKIGFDGTPLGRETKYTRCVAYQWEFIDDEFTDPTAKTATAFNIDQSDNFYQNCVALGCDVGFDIAKGFNKITGIHPYACNKNVILRNSVELQDINGYFDNGEFLIEGFSGRTKITGYFLRGASITKTDPRNYTNFITFAPDASNQTIAGVTIDAMFRNGSDEQMFTTGVDGTNGTIGSVSDSSFKMEVENIGAGSVVKRGVSGSFNATRLDLTTITPSSTAANFLFDITSLKLASNVKSLTASVTPNSYGNSRARALFTFDTVSGFTLGEFVSDASGTSGYVTCVLSGTEVIIEQISDPVAGFSGAVTGGTSGFSANVLSLDEELGTYIMIDVSRFFTATSVTATPTFRGFPYSGKVSLCRVDWSVSEGG